MSRCSTKHRRSRARRREAARIISREVELAAMDAEPRAVVLAVSELAVVFEIHGDAGVAICIAGPGAPWGQLVYGRA